MDLLKSLKFVQGAIKKNRINPELEHYQITGGQAIGFNGYMALGAPVDLDIEAQPKASLFFKALEACGDAITLGMTESGRLSIRSGGFSAFIPCVNDPLYRAEPEGETYTTPEGFAAACKRLLPFVSEDASRPWAMGLCWRDGTLLATNNLIIVQEWLGGTMPTFNCPKFAVTEIARIGIDPTSIQVSPHSVTFHFPDGRWLRTQQLSTEWPHEMVDGIFERAAGEAAPIPEGLFDAVRTLLPFVPLETTRLRFEDGVLATGDEGSGASVALDGVVAGPAFSAPNLLLLEGVATSLNLAAFPDPCGFYGDRIRGVIMGMRG